VAAELFRPAPAPHGDESWVPPTSASLLLAGTAASVVTVASRRILRHTARSRRWTSSWGTSRRVATTKIEDTSASQGRGDAHGAENAKDSLSQAHAQDMEVSNSETLHAEANHHTKAGAENHKAQMCDAKASPAEDPSAVEPEKSIPSENLVAAFGDMGRVVSIAWEVFLEVSLGKTRPKDWEYRKGIEGMSMGSLQYEMLTTAPDTAEFKNLNKEYEKGWGLGFVDLTPRKTMETLGDASKSLGLDALWLTFVNLLMTSGLTFAAGDGIPVQNKWIEIVSERLGKYMGKSDDADSMDGGQEMRSMLNYMITGQMEKIAGSPMPVFLEQYGSRCGLYKIVIGPRSVVIVSDPVVVKHILQGPQHKYTKGILSEVLEPIMGKGLIPADPQTWRSRRRAIVPGFHKKWLEQATEMMVNCAENLCDELETTLARVQPASDSSKRTVLFDMEEKFTSVSLDLIGKAVFDYDFGSVNHESPVLGAVYAVLREAERRAQSVVPYWNLPYATKIFQDQKSHEENLVLLNAVLDELIKTAIKEDVEADKAPTSLLQFLVQTRGEDVSTRQLRDDLMTLLIAGHETTAALLTWTLFELMKPENAPAMQKLRDEINEVIGCRKMAYDDVARMPFLKACLVESLRLYPQPPLLIRRCVDGDRVPVGPTCSGIDSQQVSFLAGQDIFISTWSLQRNEAFWGEDASKFNPWRWEERVDAVGAWGGYNPEKVSMYPNETASDFAFVPFGGGQRKCVGDQFALLEGSVVLASLLQRFTFEWAEQSGSGMVFTTGATVHTEGGLLVNVSSRPDFVPVEDTSAENVAKPKAKLLPQVEKKSFLSVAQRIQPEALVVPTARELRILFAQQAQLKMKEPTNKTEIEAAYEYCREVTREYSKTFFLGSQLLGDAEQRAVWAIYNWCRSTDELVDGPEAVNTTMADLEVWEQRLNDIFNLKETGDIADLAMIDASRNFKLIPRPFQDMVGGMAMDLVKDRYETFHELEVYCYRVAGTVGLMTLPILGFDPSQNFSNELKDATIDAALCLGLAFQLTNILRDVGEDARRGRIYVPLEDLRTFSIDEEEIFRASRSELELWRDERWVQFMEFQMARCRLYYEKAKNGIIGLSESNRLGVMAALNVYGGILDVVRQNNYDNFTRRAYVTLIDKVALMAKSWLACQDLKSRADENVRLGRIFLPAKEARTRLR